MRYDLKCLAVPLPEDVLKLKYYGDLERLNRVIDSKLEKDIPWALKGLFPPYGDRPGATGP